jgi:nucleoside-diphosphate-sugar epimerase
MPADVEMVRADISDPDQAIKAAAGASVIYQAANPAYHEWHRYFPGLQAGAIAAARTTGAILVSIENLYGYDPSNPIHEGSPIAPRSKKGALRAKMAADLMSAHARGEVRATALRSSDYYGPGVLGSAFGERFFIPLLHGKPGQILGARDLPHSYAYIEDVATAAVTLAQHPEALGRAWITPHAPASTQGQMASAAAEALGVEPRVSVITPLMMRLAGLFVPGARASIEMMYEFTEPFVVDSSRIEKSFRLSSTPMDEGLRRTAKWFRSSAQS